MADGPGSDTKAPTASDSGFAKRSWGDSLATYFHRRVVGMWFLGFSAGLPLLLVFSTLTLWLAEEGVSKASIGFFAWIGITYSVKVFWSPVVDQVKLPVLTDWLGRRRSWMLAGQIGIMGGLVGMGLSDPQSSLTMIALFGVAVAFSSSTQDIAIDAYRIEAADKDYQAAMSAMYIFGYRIAMLVAGAGSLYVAAGYGWTAAYVAMAVLMLIGVVTVLIVAEPEVTKNRPSIFDQPEVKAIIDAGGARHAGLVKAEAWIVGAIVSPFVDFFRRHGWIALVILGFIALYRISDLTMGIMANPFYVAVHYSKIDIANVTKLMGLVLTLVGAGIGGLVVARYGIMRPLFAGAVLVALTNVCFAWMATILPVPPLWDMTAETVWRDPTLTGVIGAASKMWAFPEPPLWPLTVTISLDNFAGGFATSAFIAYLSSLTNTTYTATQYALFSSLMTLAGKFISGWSGVIVEAAGFPVFFLYAAAAGLPAIVLVWFLMRRMNADEIKRRKAAQAAAAAEAGE